MLLQEAEGRVLDRASGLGNDDTEFLKLGEDLVTGQESRPCGQYRGLDPGVPGAIETEEIPDPAICNRLDYDAGPVRLVVEFQGPELVVTTCPGENPTRDNAGWAHFGERVDGHAYGRLRQEQHIISDVKDTLTTRLEILKG